MISLENLCHHLDDLLSSQKIEDYCPNGLQVQGKAEVRSVCTAVSASLDTIKEAAKRGADALIVHHGLFWRGDSYTIEGTKKEKLACLISNGISLLAYHLPLDKHPEIGNNWKAAKDMGWVNLEPFGLYNGVPIGVKGLVSAQSRKKMKEVLELYYGREAQCAWGGPDEIRTVGLISGGAHKCILEAARHGLDAFVTGSVDEPVWHQAKEEKINFYAVGHSNTERVGPLALQKHIKTTLSLSCSFIDIQNPF